MKIIDNVKEMLETDLEREIKPFYFVAKCRRLEAIPQPRTPRGAEGAKIEHARRFFGSLGNQAERNVVTYGPVDSCHALPKLVEV